MKIKLTILAIFVTFSTTLFAQQTLIPYRKGELWGYADTTGKVVIKPKYTRVHSTNNFERLLVSNDNKYGIVNSKGKIIVPVEYSNINRINKEGFIVKNDKKYYFFNYKGKKIIKKPYKYISHKSKGILHLHTDTLTYVYNYIEKKTIKTFSVDSEMEFDMEFEEDSEWQTGYTRFEYKKVAIGNKYGVCKYSKIYTYKNNIKVLTEKYDTLNYTFDDVKLINLNNIIVAFVKDKGKWGIFHDDVLKVKPQYDEISSTLINHRCVNFFYIVKQNNKWGVINIDGEIKIKIDYDEVKHPQLHFKNLNGVGNQKLIQVNFKDGKLKGYVNQAGIFFYED